MTQLPPQPPRAPRPLDPNAYTQLVGAPIPVPAAVSPVRPARPDRSALWIGIGLIAAALVMIVMIASLIGIAALGRAREQRAAALLPTAIPALANEIPIETLQSFANDIPREGDAPFSPPDLLPTAIVAVEATPLPGPRTTHIVQSGQELALIARQYGVDMDDILAVNDIADADLLWVGQELIIPSAGLYTPPAELAPAPPTSIGRAIVISTGEQRIYAYENGQMVRSDLVSTGRMVTPTVLGDFNVYVKYQTDDMRGADYYIPDVPWTMYFYQGYAIHGAYWHNVFGREMSHGCVNLPVDTAAWYFQFASVGTPVRVV